jgi:ribonuclease HII
MLPQPTLNLERDLLEQGYQLIAGLDEVGRGALAGPVGAAAVILPIEIDPSRLARVRDSKQLSPRMREALVGPIREEALGVGMGMIWPEVIDTCGIVEATRLAMCSALEQLPRSPQVLLIDALALPSVHLPQEAIVHGDQLSLSIACASIVAKVSRDHLMVKLDELYPGYEFAQHKGYATKKHLFNLRRLGPCPIHRKSFAPVRELLLRRT